MSEGAMAAVIELAVAIPLWIYILFIQKSGPRLKPFRKYGKKVMGSSQYFTSPHHPFGHHVTQAPPQVQATPVGYSMKFGSEIWTNEGGNVWYVVGTPQPTATTHTMANLSINTVNNIAATFLPNGPRGMYVQSKLKIRTQEEPIIAYKRARIKKSDGFKLFGVGQHAAYKPEDKAECYAVKYHDVKRTPHNAPEVGCGCGFYGMKKEMLGKIGREYTRSIADVEVEFYGKVIVHADGWRAEYQRVLGVYLDHACHFCHRDGSALYRIDDFLIPLCTHCSPDQRQNRKSYTPEVLANHWGIEVQWGSIQ